MFRLQFFGVLSFTDSSGKLIGFPTNKVRALFAYLLMQRRQWVSRQHLASLFWENSGEEVAQKNLRNTLSRLRHSLGHPAWLLSNRQAIQVCPTDTQLWLDVARFDSYWQQCEQQPDAPQLFAWMAEAVTLYHGDFLHSLTLTDSESFETWRRQKQEEYHAKILLLLERLGDQALTVNAYAAAADYARRQLTLEAWREKAHRQLMLALAASGDYTGALAQYAICQQMLWDELGIEPEDETSALFQRIHEQRQRLTPQNANPADGAMQATIDKWQPASFPIRQADEEKPQHRNSVPEMALAQFASVLTSDGSVSDGLTSHGLTSHGLAARNKPRHNLPTQLLPFVGRQRQLQELDQALRSMKYRLHVLTGMGGSGKSRLALELAQRLVDHFADGVYFVPLAELTGVNDLLPALARELALPIQDHQPLLAQLNAALQHRHLLLLLDNAEHLLGKEAAHQQTFTQLLLQLLQECPKLVLLVTSRIRLNLRVENLFQLEGLTFPAVSLPADALQALSSQDLLQFEAVRLFVEQAQRVDKRFQLADNAKWIVQICQQLQGLPLGIELAAAQLAESESATVAAALASNLSGLQVDYADLPARHQSLRAIFDYSWQRLPPAQQTVLACCALFQGGFDPEDLPILLPSHTPSALMPLLEHSLLHQQSDGRCHFHPLVQQCARQHLPRIGLDQSALEVQRNHAFLLRLSRLSPLFAGEQLSTALAATERNWENFHAAWQSALRHNLLDSLEGALDSFFAAYFYRRFHEAGAALWAQSYAKLHESSADLPGAEKAQREQLMVRLQLKQARHLLAIDCFDEAVALLDPLTSQALASDLEMEAYLIHNWCDRRVDEAGRQRAAQLYSRITQPRLQAEYWHGLALQQIDGGHFAHAYRSSAQSIALYQTCQDLAGQIMAYHTHATIAMQLGNLQQARTHLESAMRLAAQRRDLWAEGFLHEMLGVVASRLGDHSAAIASFTFELQLDRQSGRRNRERMMLMNLALEESLLGQYARARSRYARVLGLLANDLKADRVECVTRMNLALLLHTIGEQEEALRHGERALQLLRTLQLPSFEGYALTNLGHIFCALGRWQESANAYQTALSLRQQLDETVLQLETRAGLARLALAQADLPAAQAWVAPILAHLQSQTLDGVEEPMRVYLTCYRVLAASDDPQTSHFARQMRAQLDERARRISDLALRRSFLEEVPSHREILQEG